MVIYYHRTVDVVQKMLTKDIIQKGKQVKSSHMKPSVIFYISLTSLVLYFCSANSPFTVYKQGELVAGPGRDWKLQQ